MLTILGRSDKKAGFCDGVSRRGFLKVGGAALGGLALPQILELEAAAESGQAHQAIINIYLPGGPSHIDMWDLKPNAPTEIRGEFKPIATNVPGIEICELFPKVAAMMDKFAIVRTISDSEGRHAAYQCMTGHKFAEPGPPGGWPSAGAWVSRLAGKMNDEVPSNVAMMYPTGERRWGMSESANFLGGRHDPFNVVTRKVGSRPENMILRGITLEQLHDRARLCNALDHFRREVDSTVKTDHLGDFTEQALGILTRSRLVDALDVSQEDPKILERYGKNDSKFQRDGAPKMIENFCIARRLVEAGARYVALNYSRWDWHGPDGLNFPRSHQEFPLLDQGLSALVTDLHERGLDQDVSVVVWGEFGRTPKINKKNSRDHWPQNNACLLAGGGMRTGQVIGKTNAYAERPIERPVKFQEVFATLYHNLGLNAHDVRVFDTAGTPRYAVDTDIEPMRELI